MSRSPVSGRLILWTRNT